jgi:hypothetical protein
MHRTATLFVLFYLTATVAVSADRTADVAKWLGHTSTWMSQSHVDEQGQRFDAYPHFREAQKKRSDFWVNLEIAVSLRPPTQGIALIGVCEKEIVVYHADRRAPARSPPAS